MLLSICTVALKMTVDANANDYYADAYRVFDRVFAVADKSDKRYPILEIISDDIFVAEAEPSGEIKISKKAIEFCYLNVSEIIGDTCLAFIIAHEMAHLALSHSLLKTDLPNETQCMLTKRMELEADANALVIIAMAKFDPSHIFYQDFIQKWIDHSSTQTDVNNTCYPTSKERKENLKKQIIKVINNIDLFYTGVRLYQVGMYDDSLQFFKQFCEIFYSREVFNNIGLIYYQKAIEMLTRYDPQKACYFELSTVLDTVTLADIFKKISLTKGDNEKYRRLFRKYLLDAEKQLVVALGKDNTYLPAYINLSSVYILLDQFDEAKNQLDKYWELSKEIKKSDYDSSAKNNEAVILFMASKNSGKKQKKNQVAQIKDSIKKLKGIIQSDPKKYEVYYNLGIIQYEQNQKDEAYDNWKKYLKLCPEGFYAMVIREKLGLNILTTNQSITDKYPDPTPVKPGDEINNRIGKKFQNDLSVEFNFSDNRYRLYKQKKEKGYRALLKEYCFILIENSNDNPLILDTLGKPNRKFKQLDGIETWVFQKLAVDIKNQKIVKIVYF